ncbi:glycosyltransferase [Flavobacterium sp.]|uniref:glycosyltransferase n=1 Tax=Flavobacterium sp. TaxID=239 RepID=UPI00286DB7BC|nr:glycosyltransferase [Flavobacterium sp.]
MKIIRLTTLLDFGGQERKYIIFVEDGSKALKNDYFFAALGHGGYAEKYILEKGFQVKIFDSKPQVSNVKNIWLLYKWFKAINPDIVHTAAAEANFHGIIAAKLAGVKVIIAEEIGLPKHSKKAKIIFKYLYKLTNKVICVSEAVKNFLIDSREIKNQKGIVIYNPASEPKTTKRVLSNEFTIVTVGRLEIVKNHQLLIRAFSQLNDLSTKLILVGDGRERGNLEQLIASLHLENRVTITGFVSNPEHFLAQAHLFVLPSLSEGFGIAVVEAMLQAVPCLCSNVGGIPEFISEKETGWLFNPNHEEELVTKINGLIATPYGDLQVIGNKGKNFVNNRFTSQKYRYNLENLYQELS